MTPDDPSPDAPAKPGPRRFSEMLQDLAEGHDEDRLTVGHLMQAMRGRAIAALLFIFAFPNILPTPPGVAAILGLPLIYLSSQLMLDRAPWLPRFIAERSMTHEAFRSIVARAAPVLTRAEKMLRERWAPLTSPVMERAMGLVCLVLAVLLSLPIPLGNLMPSAAICVIALALLERDGLWLLIGLATTGAAFVWVGGMAFALAKSAAFVVMNAF